MSNDREPNQSIRATINGNVSGQVAIGQNINQSQTQIHQALTDAELQELQQILARLKSQVEVEAPAEKRADALARVEELQQAITEKEPDLTTMDYVRKWFGKHIPGLAGAVASVVVHPLVGKLVEAAGGALAADFRQRFGGS
jgi:hypothetical protein